MPSIHPFNLLNVIVTYTNEIRARSPVALWVTVKVTVYIWGHFLVFDIL